MACFLRVGKLSVCRVSTNLTFRKWICYWLFLTERCLWTGGAWECFLLKEAWEFQQRGKNLVNPRFCAVFSIATLCSTVGFFAFDWDNDSLAFGRRGRMDGRV